LVLQPFTGERRTPGGRPEQETSHPFIGRGPDQVADTLKTEHRVVNIERQHRQPVNAVRGGRVTQEDSA
jgi:hypothetical protein